MYTSKYLLSTMKEIPKNTESISHQLMLRSGMIRMLSSGIYTWLPTGQRIIQKVINVIKKIMNNYGALEICLPLLQPKKFWDQSGRTTLYGAELINVVNRRKKRFILSPTHEEVITYIMHHEINSYKQLPIIFYQIQKKFRDETRPQFGVIRSIEFLMKDAYSFHINQKSLQKTYHLISNAYKKIFKKLKINFDIVTADSGVMGGSISHEFCATTNNILKKNNEKNIEIGHIFQLHKKYSKIINKKIQNKKKEKKFMYMGCYGLGINRIIAAIIEQNHDYKGIIWPQNISPFQISIVPINMHKIIEVKKLSCILYKKLKNEHLDVLFDDRNESYGKMLKDMELIGIPHNIVISANSIKKKNVEYFSRKKKIKKNISIYKIISFLKKKLK